MKTKGIVAIAALTAATLHAGSAPVVPEPNALPVLMGGVALIGFFAWRFQGRNKK